MKTLIIILAMSLVYAMFWLITTPIIFLKLLSEPEEEQ